ncbi:dihydroorotase [Allofrancisella guangzhouensis]|uniref:Dihydroorotase n=1 Tax=Allofrancisella guangzhouensis TaxID=594679 RepID=A0A0A8E424_9GAMM|nr:dihydroorotase [Allofrancisella guangzhouensis]AJC48362.1 dihydroorotase [Allofrancisella guangzhouensis]MBK2026544.1 dihydroorotase [Allofrancisella guangzhouensis]MBK2044288.1 dihydroorotase [Allofrancisella guangzhouensis]MBK2045531.1 dihydroorotase [Allofrancisella guangzhouensis]
MSTQSLLIKNATVVNEGKIFKSDVFIENDKITQINNQINKTADKVIDASGLYLLPGMIDDQVHFREPGLMHKADIESESKAAVMGGITSYMEMPNVNPATTIIERLNEKKERASQRSHANYAFYLGATNNNVDELKRLKPNDACGVKIFMGASTGDMLVDNQETLEGFFANSPLLIVTHCEDTPMIKANEDKVHEKYGENVPFDLHPDIRSREACFKSSTLAVTLAKKYNSRLHVLHLTTAEEMVHFSNELPLEQKRITAEVCAHHLFFSRKDYAEKGALIKCNPAIKEETDRLALLEAVKNDVIDVIATDHAPHTWEEKQGTYFKAPAGLPLVEQALISVLEHYHKGFLSLEQVAQKTAHAPAIVYKVKNRGFIREGYMADLVLVDLNNPHTITDESCHYKCGWTPFAGYTFQSKIHSTIVNGILKYHQGKIVSDKKGQALEFDHQF